MAPRKGWIADALRRIGPCETAAGIACAFASRLLPLLSTHLSAPEIAAEMYLSVHTIKTQARLIYRKLGATSRSQPSPGPASSASWRPEDGSATDRSGG